MQRESQVEDMFLQCSEDVERHVYTCREYGIGKKKVKVKSNYKISSLFRVRL